MTENAQLNVTDHRENYERVTQARVKLLDSTVFHYKYP